ncbi:MAG TPA: MFS transporter [Tepidisphaeraceae bacterium]|jgi:MFS family permease|nr:MFS transporter [Tepidisphaeraceae bacterium]
MEAVALGANQEPGMGARLLRALRHRNYRLYFTGQGISLIGTWLTQVATSWLVYRLTGSTVLLGVVAFAGQIPLFVLSPFMGVLVDRWNRHRILIVTQTIAMLQSFALAYLALRKIITVHHIIVLNAIQGVVNSLDMPARQAFLVEIVESRTDLPNAIALNSSMVNGARLIGPSIAGVLIAAVGEGICFLIDGISYIAVVIALLAMRVRRTQRTEASAGALSEMWNGVKYAFGFAPIRAILLLAAVVSLTGVSYSILMPVFATQILHGGPRLLGFLMAMSGVGALAGALFLAARRTVVGLGRVIVIAGIVFGGALVVFAFSRVLWISMMAMVLMGFSMITFFASSNTVLQTVVDDHMRGRVMSFFGMAFMGMMPFGSLISGWLAARVGPAWTVAISGLAAAGACGVFAMKLSALRDLVRPIYVQKGIIIEEVAKAVNVASELEERA